MLPKIKLCPRLQQGSFGRCGKSLDRLVQASVDQLSSHDAPPLFHSPLQGSQVTITELSRTVGAQPVQYGPGRDVGFRFQPSQDFLPHSLEGIRASTPMAWSPDPGSVGGTVFTLLPEGGQLGQELLQALLLGWLTVIGGRKGHQGGLCFADGMQEGYRVPTDAVLGHLLFSFIGHRLVLQQPVTGSGWRAVPLDRG